MANGCADEPVSGKGHPGACMGRLLGGHAGRYRRHVRRFDGRGAAAVALLPALRCGQPTQGLTQRPAAGMLRAFLLDKDDAHRNRTQTWQLRLSYLRR